MFKGVFFNVSRTVLEEEVGTSVWEKIQEFGDLRERYEDLANYSWEEWGALVESATEVLDKSRRATIRWMGKQWIPEFKRRHPVLFEGYSCLQDFLSKLHQEVLPGLKKQYPGIQLPDISITQQSDNEISLEFFSREDLCALMVGILEGLADIYSATVQLTQPDCTCTGDETCRVQLQFNPG